MLTACYDRSCSPSTYDVVAALLHFEAERIRSKEKEIRLIILPGPAGGHRKDSMWPKSIEARQKMFEAVVIPMCGMLPSVASIEVQKSVDHPAIGIGQPLYGLKKFISALPISGRCLRPKRKRMPQPKLVTITLREAEHWPQRNSDFEEWLKAAFGLSDRGFDVVFIRDTNRADDPVPGFDTDAESSCDLEARASLYRSAFCNMFVSNGPAWLAIALDAPVLMFKPTTEELGACYSELYFADCGLLKGSQLRNSPSHQHIVWGPDNSDVILREFDDFVLMQRAAA